MIKNIHKVDRKKFRTQYGFIEYHYEKSHNYPNGIMIFMGSYINKEYRKTGKFKDMVLSLFKNIPENTEVHVALATHYLVNFFERLGFRRVDSIEYWGKLENTINLTGFIK